MRTNGTFRTVGAFLAYGVLRTGFTRTAGLTFREIFDFGARGILGAYLILGATGALGAKDLKLARETDWTLETLLTEGTLGTDGKYPRARQMVCETKKKRQ